MKRTYLLALLSSAVSAGNYEDPGYFTSSTPLVTLTVVPIPTTLTTTTPPVVVSPTLTSLTTFVGTDTNNVGPILTSSSSSSIVNGIVTVTSTRTFTDYCGCGIPGVTTLTGTVNPTLTSTSSTSSTTLSTTLSTSTSTTSDTFSVNPTLISTTSSSSSSSSTTTSTSTVSTTSITVTTGQTILPSPTVTTSISTTTTTTNGGSVNPTLTGTTTSSTSSTTSSSSTSTTTDTFSVNPTLISTTSSTTTSTSTTSSTTTSTTTSSSSSSTTTSSTSSSSTTSSTTTTVSTTTTTTTTTAPTTTTTSTTTSTSTTTTTSAGPIVTDQAYINTILRHHNQHRANHSANALTWSPSLAETARKIGSTCNYGHNVTADGGGYGQNIGAGYPSTAMGQFVTEGLYNPEVNSYTYYGGEPNTATVGQWGHFSQIVWKATGQVGCYTYDCSAQGLQNAPGIPPFFTVCNYAPAGNVVGAFAQNVGAPLGFPTIDAMYGCPTRANCV